MNKIRTTLSVLILGFVVFMAGSWFINIYKLTQCDFQSPYKGEILHAVGIIVAPVSVITVWNTEK